VIEVRLKCTTSKHEHAVHPNLHGHSGGGLSLGRGFPVVGSTKHKLNTRSSTESKLAGADDFMPVICWTRHFMEAQGHKVKDNTLCQDNVSSILLEKNGKASSSKRAKHVSIRCFFITNQISKNELLVVWCPAGNKIGDCATKPLQGAVFKKSCRELCSRNSGIVSREWSRLKIQHQKS
jgi:hypothetical protein